MLSLLLCAVGAAAAGVCAATPIGARISSRAMGWALALAPLSAFIALLLTVPDINAGAVRTWSLAWMPSLGLNATLRLDGLSLLFGLLVSGIGVLVVIYAGYYFGGQGDNTDSRFFFYITLFMTAMLGLVLAGDAITLFVFWEGTSITSFLLVAYKTKDEAARQGAFRALFITGGGGVALLAGLIFVSLVSGSAEFSVILQQGDALRASPLYPLMLALIALGAFTKSAQAPAHFWLPGAMSAPTPASAFLHSATMVKAGVYLLARMNPALGNTNLWFWLLSGVGLVTMLIGAFVGLKQHDLKALLAYSTVSQLGALVMLIGQDTEIAFKALSVSIVAHALYKSALFLVAGIVDHETGTRDLRQLGGIARAMPFTFAVTGIAALSMAGLPPLFGFLAKETLLATATHPTVPPIVDVIFPLAAVVAGALILAQAGLIVLDGFLGQPRGALHPHEAPAPMWLMPGLPALVSLAIGVLPEPEALAKLLAAASGAALGAPVKVSLALWTGINIPLVLSAVAVSVGVLLLIARHRVRPALERATQSLRLNGLYDAALRGIDGSAWLVTRVQNGKLRLYLVIMLLSMAALVFGVAGTAWLPRLPLREAQGVPALSVLRALVLLIIAGAALSSVFLRRDLFAIFALAVSGLSIAAIMVLEPAPDIALVQVIVEVLTAVVLVLVLTRLPVEQRVRAAEFTFRQSRRGLLRDAVVSAIVGVVVFLLAFTALSTRPRESQVTPFFEQNAKPLTSANDIVGAIIVDFRAFDTFIEIAVFATAGMAIYTLLRYASRKAGDREMPFRVQQMTLLGIGGERTSPFVRTLARFLLPLTFVISISHVLLGHDQPGDGFTAGVILSLGVAAWYVAFGYAETKRALAWLKPYPLISAGLGLALIVATLSALINPDADGAPTRFFSPMDFGKLLGFGHWLPAGVYFSSATLFELAIALAVVGTSVLILDTLGRPKDTDAETEQQMSEIAALRARGEVTLPETTDSPVQDYEHNVQRS